MKGYLRERDRRRNRRGPCRTWQLVVEASRDPSGRRRQIFRSFSGTRREAENALALLITEARAGTVAMNTRLTVGEYCDRWLRERAESREVGEKTLVRYEGIIRDHIKPILGRRRLAELTPSLVTDTVQLWRSADRRDRKHGRLADRTIHHHFSLLKQLIGDAVRAQIIPLNPAGAVRAPKKTAPEGKAYTIDQILVLLESLAGKPLESPTLIKALTGLRRGELLGLKWPAVDLAQREIHVQLALERRKDKTLHFKIPKTRKSLRTIALPDVAVDKLRELYAVHLERRGSLGSAYNPHDLVFCTPTGDPWDPDAFSSAFSYHLRTSGLAPVSLHELRHSFASIHGRAGTPLKTTSDALGHATSGITAEIYTHTVLNDQHDAAVTLHKVYTAAKRRRADLRDTNGASKIAQTRTV